MPSSRFSGSAHRASEDVRASGREALPAAEAWRKRWRQPDLGSAAERFAESNDQFGRPTIPDARSYLPGGRVQVGFGFEGGGRIPVPWKPGNAPWEAGGPGGMGPMGEEFGAAAGLAGPFGGTRGPGARFQGGIGGRGLPLPQRGRRPPGTGSGGFKMPFPGTNVGAVEGRGRPSSAAQRERFYNSLLTSHERNRPTGGAPVVNNPDGSADFATDADAMALEARYQREMKEWRAHGAEYSHLYNVNWLSEYDDDDSDPGWEEPVEDENEGRDPWDFTGTAMPNPDDDGDSPLDPRASGGQRGMGDRFSRVMPNPDGTGPVGPWVRTRGRQRGGFVQFMPAPDDVGPVGPWARAGAAWRGRDIMPNPDDNGPVGPNMRVARRG